MIATPNLTVAGLEAVYDALATAIDQATETAGEAASEKLLVKLALLAAQDLGDAERFQHLIQLALQDL